MFHNIFPKIFFTIQVLCYLSVSDLCPLNFNILLLHHNHKVINFLSPGVTTIHTTHSQTFSFPTPHTSLVDSDYVMFPSKKLREPLLWFVNMVLARTRVSLWSCRTLRLPSSPISPTMPHRTFICTET